MDAAMLIILIPIPNLQYLQFTEKPTKFTEKINKPWKIFTGKDASLAYSCLLSVVFSRDVITYINSQTISFSSLKTVFFLL